LVEWNEASHGGRSQPNSQQHERKRESQLPHKGIFAHISGTDQAVARHRFLSMITFSLSTRTALCY